ncbi:MAG TPA: hypothetical protein VK276_04510 [Rubrobacteraceae bacterium]|nr:hypothetical protein [Rubrobacteraceae bacterium]
MTEPRDTDPMNSRYLSADRGTLPEEWGGGSDHFAAQLGASRSGHLRFTNGAHRVVIRAGSHLRGLYRARFGERMPVVEVRGGVVSIRSTWVASCDWTGNHPERPAEVALNAGIPWDVEVRGASRLLADLSGLRLGSLSVDGGASRLEVVLPDPSGAVSVVILGGASNVAIRRPEGVAARLRVEGGVTNLTFDDRRIGATGGELVLRSRGYEDAVDRYDIAVTGGANNMSIERQQGDREGADRDQEGE